MEQPFLFITARASSRRLPNKALLMIGAKSVLEHVVDRAKSVRFAKGVVLCTSTDPADDELARIASAMGAVAYRGPLDDKPARWLGAAQLVGADYFVSYDGDDLFCDPELMELAIEQMRDPIDFLRLPEGLVVGGGAVCVSVAALNRLAALVPAGFDDPWRYFSEQHSFNVRELSVPDRIFFNDQTRLTLDYSEDLLFFQTVFRELRMTRNRVPLRDILLYLGAHPDVCAINLFRQQDYLDNRRRLAGPPV